MLLENLQNIVIFNYIMNTNLKTIKINVNTKECEINRYAFVFIF
jgi:hypothetical protein